MRYATATGTLIVTGLIVTTSLALPLEGTGRSSSAAAPGGATEVTVIIESLAPDGGSFLTPTWVGFHDGGFDIYDGGAPAAEFLERLAEDGATGPIAMAFDDSGAGSAEATIIADVGIPPIGPGETATMTFTLDPDDPASRYFSYAAMVLPSNDAFIANAKPRKHRIFRNNGNFLGADFLVLGSAARDAGTELNDEAPENTAFFGQMAPNTGLDECTVVRNHVGFKYAECGGILADPMYPDADFTAPGYVIARIRIVADGRGGGNDGHGDGHGDGHADGHGD